MEYYEQEQEWLGEIEGDDVVNAFETGAEWAQKFMIERACEWLYNNFYEHPHEKNFICSENFATIEDMVSRFQIIIEE